MIAALDRFVEVQLQAHKVRVLRPLERKLATRLADVWRRQGRRFAGKLETLRTQFPLESAEGARRLREAVGDEWESQWDQTADETQDDFEAAFSDLLEQAALTGGTSLYSSLGLPVGVTADSPAIQSFLDGIGDLVTGLDATTKERLRTLIGEAIDSGTSYNKVAGQIQTLFDGFTRQRANTAAVTELGRAYEQGAIGSARDVAAGGTELEKAWVDVEDSSECEDCQSNADAGFIALDDTFPTGDDAPPNHPGCRCSNVFTVVDGSGDATDQGDTS